VTGLLPEHEPRYPSFKGIMAAKKKPVQTLAFSGQPAPERVTEVWIGGR
jgi:electron transfer flavoprotein alpha/beta subunit